MLDALQAPKTLPHSEESERAVLAAVLLDPRLLPTVSGRLNADDLYLEKHGILYSTMLELQEEQTEIDLRTLQAKLEQKGHLERIGGIAYLASLDLDLPDLGRVETYVEIVKERSVRRRLIETSSTIIRDCLDGGVEADLALGRAEQAIFSLGEEAIQRGFAQLGEILGPTLEDLEERPGSMLIGVPTGFTDFDRMTHGLNRGNLIIIAGRPGMGKTSLALNIAQHVALRENRGAAIFSLEMSQQELALRILCSEANVPFGSLRRGHLSQAHWKRIIGTARSSSNAPLYIDDSPNPTLLEVASKARRLKAEKGLELLILDYLQLMQAGGRYENRNLEIAAISRGMKQLAKELEIPVIALSQLSRQPERRGSDHRPQLSDLRESGCLTGDTLVPLADGGGMVPIGQLAGDEGFRVWALDERSLKLVPAEVSRAFSTGRKPVFRLTTQLGRTIRATANHRFRTFDGWKRLDELEAGDHLALPRELATTGEENDAQSADRLALLGHLIGDGCTLPNHAIQYTTRERELADLVAGLASRVFGDEVKPRVVRERSWYQVYLASTRRHTHGVRSAVAEWLDGLGAWGWRSVEKRLPVELFEHSAESIAHFVRHLWATDGCLHAGKRYPAIYYATSSRRLAEELQLLLLHLGLNTRLRVSSQGDKGKDQFHVVVSGKADMLLFAERVGAVGKRRRATLEKIRRDLEARVANTNRDVIPAAIWQRYVKPAMQEAGVTHRQLHDSLGMAYAGMTIFRQNVSRQRAERVAEAVDSDELRKLAASDVYWDRVATIEPDGHEEVFDLTVPYLHNFVANGVVVHNSIEQDADLVAFVYRDEVYHPDDDDVKNLAELIVAKHRNGETGTVDLVFLGETTSFKNRDRHGLDSAAPPPY